MQCPEVGEIGPVPRDLDGAAGPVADIVSGGVGEFGRERRIARGRLEIERQQFAPFVVQLGDGSEHAGGRVPCTRGGVGALSSPSTTVTPRPRWAQRHAMARPMTPPPMMITSRLDVTIAPSVHAACMQHRAAVAGVRSGLVLPAPALPGSGSTVGGSQQPSQPSLLGSRAVATIRAAGQISIR